MPDTSEVTEKPPQQNGAYVRSEDHGHPSPRTARPGPPDEPTSAPVGPSPIDLVEIFAESMTQSVWDGIAAELGEDTATVTAIKLQLAQHGWCDLFVGLVQVVEAYGSAVNAIPEWAKRRVKDAILDSSMTQYRPQVTSAVVDVVVDRVWSAFKAAMIGNVPLLDVITREETLRSLRILTVFICPAPGDHKEVREHALEPLGEDARKLLTEHTKARLGLLFDEWKVDTLAAAK